MTAEIEPREKEILEQLRHQYERKGYKFIVEPTGKDLPAFLGEVIPDAIAVGKDDSVVVEVKLTKASAGQSAAVKYLASEVPKHPGWRFDLVVAEGKMGAIDADVEPEHNQLVRELEKVRATLVSGDNKVALILGWALLEAFTRNLVLNKREGEPKRYLPRTVVETLVSEGYADDETGARLSNLAAARNRLVHGFSKQEVGKSDLDFLVDFLDLLAGELV